MNDPLENGAILPHGLLSENAGAMIEGFNKSYKNFPLRVGVVTASYPPSDTRNRSKLTIEYDVIVIEQNADIGATTILYRNCMSAEGLGSIADYLEMALRFTKKKTTKGDSINTKGQDGAIVLMLCLDGMSDKGIIIGALTHPDRPTNLTDQGPLLVGEYNGVKVTVNEDGSTSLVFKGATNNSGSAVDPSQGNTTVQIQKDGSFQVDHSTITFLLNRGGFASLTAKKEITLATQGKVLITANGDVDVNCANANVTSSGKTIISASEIDLNGATGNILTTVTDPVVDLITGVPTQGVPTVKSG